MQFFNDKTVQHIYGIGFFHYLLCKPKYFVQRFKAPGEMNIWMRCEFGNPSFLRSTLLLCNLIVREKALLKELQLHEPPTLELRYCVVQKWVRIIFSMDI